MRPLGSHDDELSNGVDLMYEHHEEWHWATGESAVLQFVTVHRVEDGLITLKNMNDEVLESIHFAGRSAEQFNRGIEDNPDWPQAERDGFDMRPVNAETNAFHYRAVVLMSLIAEALGEDEDLLWYRERARLIRETFVAKLVDPVTGLVLDGEGSTHSSLHANMTALAFGLVPEANHDAVVDHLKSKGMACSVYGSQFLMEALYEAGEDDFALTLLTSTSERSWAHMVYDVGTTIALLERGSKVMSAIHKRLYSSMRHEFKLLSKIISTYLPPEYPYDVVGGQRNIKQTDFDDRIDIVYSGLPMIEIVPAGSGKGTCLAWLAQQLELKQENVFAFGDGMNDLSMLQWAGTGIAMGQSHQRVKASADLIIGSVDEEGIAEWIENNLSN